MTSDTFDSRLDTITRFGYRNETGMKRFSDGLLDDELFLKILFDISRQYDEKSYNASIVLKHMKKFQPTVIMTSLNFCSKIDHVFITCLFFRPQKKDIYSYFGLPFIVFNTDYYTNLPDNRILMLKGDSDNFKTISINFKPGKLTDAI